MASPGTYTPSQLSSDSWKIVSEPDGDEEGRATPVSSDPRADKQDTSLDKQRIRNDEPMPPIASSQAPGGPVRMGTDGFRFPSIYSFPPFYTMQPNLTTREAQLQSWSDLILSCCEYRRTFRITPSHAIFDNAAIKRRLDTESARGVLDWMAQRGRIEWLDAKMNKKEEAYVWWRTPEEWASSVAEWVEETGQKNTVLTLFELVDSDATSKQTFHGMPMDVLHKALQVLVKRNRASIFGEGDSLGVKFY